MSPPVFSPGIGEQVLVRTREGWSPGVIGRTPDRETVTYMVSVDGNTLHRSIFDLRPAVPEETVVPADFVEDVTPTDVRVATITKRHATRHARFTRRVELCRGLLETLADDYDAETAHRMAKALEDLTDGYDENPDLKALLKTFDVDGDPGIVVVRGMPFASVCEHHVLPFTGTVDVAYLPHRKIVGLSKIPRLVRMFSRRLQVQERIGQQVADALENHIDGCRGAMVVIRGRHSCMALRGVQSPGEMVTSAARGVFLHDQAARAEALELLRI